MPPRGSQRRNRPFSIFNKSGKQGSIYILIHLRPITGHRGRPSFAAGAGAGAARGHARGASAPSASSISRARAASQRSGPAPAPPGTWRATCAPPASARRRRRRRRPVGWGVAGGDRQRRSLAAGLLRGATRPALGRGSQRARPACARGHGRDRGCGMTGRGTAGWRSGCRWVGVCVRGLGGGGAPGRDPARAP